MITSEKLLEVLPVFHPSLDDNTIETFQLISTNTTCLALSTIQYKYRYVSVSITYKVSFSNGLNETYTALIDLGCSTDNKWDTKVLGPEVSFAYIDPVPSNSLRIDCAKCVSNTHPSNINSDPITHCQSKIMILILLFTCILILACHSNCLVMNTISGCTGPLETDCCLVYRDGLCNDTGCSENELMMDNFTCATKPIISADTVNTSFEYFDTILGKSKLFKIYYNYVCRKH